MGLPENRDTPKCHGFIIIFLLKCQFEGGTPHFHTHQKKYIAGDISTLYPYDIPIISPNSLSLPWDSRRNTSSMESEVCYPPAGADFWVGLVRWVFLGNIVDICCGCCGIRNFKTFCFFFGENVENMWNWPYTRNSKTSPSLVVVLSASGFQPLFAWFAWFALFALSSASSSSSTSSSSLLLQLWLHII